MKLLLREYQLLDAQLEEQARQLSALRHDKSALGHQISAMAREEGALLARVLSAVARCLIAFAMGARSQVHKNKPKEPKVQFRRGQVLPRRRRGRTRWTLIICS